ncbi:uncharacterized protein ALTATR162_LOCUS4221 [Alternaria atra]|uniref:PRP38-assoc multi-domain protein n=1 Tax=Alternaria atra TaxID=119953 RepID=A0A8J2I0Z0_9PLEO|nr:uncharacterized protein ALTATR162_LOCUS4221 [Alternaria atra]CAG5156423.1 unnamed protein product [Alternaria atra]
MAALAFKAISYGAEQIPDKFFEKIPGGYFTPAEQKEIKKHRKDRKDREGRERHHSEEKSSKRSSRQERSPPTEYSDYYTDDTDYERERERRKRERRRAKSTGTTSRSLSRGRHGRHSSDLDGQHSDPRDMAQPQQGQPYFPPPPTSEYKPYNPQEYAPSPVQDHRPSATPAYGYSPQLSAYVEKPDNVDFVQPFFLPASFASHDFSRFSRFCCFHSPAPAEPRGVTLDYGQREAPRSSRYTPGPGYAPSPAVDAPIPPPPVGSNSPMNPYHHTEFPATGAGYQPSPPPFSRQRSNSQPTFAPVPSAVYPTYIPPSAEQPVVAYNESQPRSRRESTKPRREHRHRARSVDSHSHQSRSSKDHRRDDSRMTKVRDRFDSMDLREKSLAASVGGAAAGALGARQIATRSRSRSNRRSTSRSRSRSRTRAHERERSKGPGLRARSRSVIDRFRSKSRGHDDRDARRDDRRDRDRRPDHGYDYGRDDYDYFSSDSDGDGSPVKTRRHRKRDY